MKQLKISVPEKKDFKRWTNILWFKLNGGFLCTKCGTKDSFNHVHFESTAHNKRIMLENRTAGICADCTRDELNDKADVVFTEDDCTCDWCGEQKATTSFPRHKDLESQIFFGSQWWNGHHMCQACMNTCFDNRGPNRSSVIKHEDGILFYKNELGLWIKAK